MPDDPGLIDLETTILLLPTISRGAHLDGPILHAQNLIELWKPDSPSGAVPLTLAFRLLNVEAVARAVYRAAAAKDYSSRPWDWDLPGAEALLSELRAIVWQAMLEGTLQVEAIKGVRGKRYRTVLPTELPRLRPDMRLSRLCSGDRDEFIGVRVRRAPAEPVKPTWRPEKPSRADLGDWLRHLTEQEYPDAEHRPDRRPSFEVLQTKANDHFKTRVPRDDLRAAIKDAAPQLKRSPGQRTVK